ncbi:DNA primase [Leptolyngbya sp. 'hensonii']|uniref:DNA primase n=1 Tax=Leptolyngbya sp. 'hensonii' TaxID=1922337 RepID=UPI00094FFD13|nr:DNA primase [Leptolyngbya sp. 'hensonii']OLP19032.1 DNA primase [Leptolyngbya sp. 'hensonii']
MATVRLHPDTIEEVKEKADIVDVVSEHVVLRKQGKDFTGLCPFHDDKSPSFSVSPSKQFYYCFSCGAAGNAFKFLMELNRQSFTDVVLQLARRYQVQIKTLEPEQRQELQRQLSIREQLHEILSLTARFYEHALQQPQGREALEYLLVSRKLDPAAIQQFQLGYAPASWETLYGYLVEQKHYPVDLAEKAGLILPRKSGGSYYDRFRDRLMIPIHDLQGRVIGFGGRALGEEQPKYLNSPETELFDKGKTLFALDKARSAIAKQDQAVVVEGYFDAISLHAHGISNVVASLGTALGANQVKLLLRYTESKQVVFNFDADAAGSKAVDRAIGEVANLAYQGQVQLRVLTIPDGKDPDEFLRSHPPEEYRDLLSQAPLWLDWQIQQALAGRDLKQADQFQQGVQEIVKLLGNLPNATLRTHYIHQCAGLLSQGDGRIALRLEEDLRQQVRGQRWHGRSQKWESSADYTLRESAEAQLLRIYLHCPDDRPAVREALTSRDLEFGLSHHRFLWRQILELEEQNIPAETLMMALRDRCIEASSSLKQVIHLFQLDEKTELEIHRPALMIRSAAASLERIMCEKRCRHLLSMWEEASQSDFQAQEAQDQGEADPISLVDPLAADLQAWEAATEEESPRSETQRRQAFYQSEYYKEKRHLQQLDQQRCVTASELTQFS